MKRCYQTKKNVGLKKSICFQSLIILYVLFLTVSQMTSPTTAHFNDTAIIVGNISIADTFDEENVVESVEVNENQENQGNQENQEIKKNENNQIKDKENMTNESDDTDTSPSTEVIVDQKVADPVEVVQPSLEPEISNPATQLEEEQEEESDVVEK